MAVRLGNRFSGVGFRASQTQRPSFVYKSKMSKEEQLDRIKAKIIADKVCPELAAGATQLVFSDGSAEAEIVFIGEAPGKNEDEQGLPFVGAAGKFLDELLAGIGMDRQDVYITNIVKYRPPDNRDPYPDEKADFLPYLKAQLEVIRPKLVVLLGRHSMECFLPGLQISKIHGQPKRLHGWVFLPLYHPAAALYNGGMRQTLTSDFAKIPRILGQITELPKEGLELNEPEAAAQKPAPQPKAMQRTIFDNLV
jgi:DNA polymerase